MLKRLPHMPMDGSDTARILLTHLGEGNDVIRTGAVRALAAQVPGEDSVREALLGALLDEDPDVRTDAMEALASFARPDDAEKIRESLMGDPVREVKLAAIDLLVQLRDQDSIALLRALTRGRAEDQVAWEDEAGLWDEWLDIQAAAIRALGQLGATDAVEDMLAARDDEFGQNLDLPVFDALANLGEAGMVWLLATAQTEPGLARKRALEAMTKIDPQALEPHLDFLLGDGSAEVRRLALPMLSPTDDRLAYLALKDTDAALRATALTAAAPARPDLAVAALSDDAPEVQAVALDHLTLPLDGKIAEALNANLQAWLVTGDGVLAAAAARNWRRLQSEAAPGPLWILLDDETRPLDARIAAAQGLSDSCSDLLADDMQRLLTNASQQVRMVALQTLVRRAEAGQGDAVSTLCQAVSGTLLEVSAPNTHPATQPEVPRLRITKTGQVESGASGDGTFSTLEAIQINRVATAKAHSGLTVPKANTDGREGKKQGRKSAKRRNIEGPDDVAGDLTRHALALVGKVPDPAIETAILSRTGSFQDELRIAAFQALAHRVEGLPLSDQAQAVLHTGLMDRTPRVRALAARIVTQLDPAVPALRSALQARADDPDVLVRAEAVAAQDDRDMLLESAADSAAQIRAAATAKLLSEDAQDVAKPLIIRLLKAEAADTLTLAAEASPILRDAMLQRLDTEAEQLPVQEAHLLLMGLAGRA